MGSVCLETPGHADPSLHAYEIGCEKYPQTVRVMMIQDDPEIGPYFSGDVEVMRYRNEHTLRYLRRGKEGQYIETASRLRDEFKVPCSQKQITPNHWLFAAENPYGDSRIYQARFKRPTHHGPNERPDFTKRAFDDSDQVFKKTELYTRDFFERGSYLTAGWFESTPVERFEEEGPRRHPKKRIICYGACTHPNGLIKRLKDRACCQSWFGDLEAERRNARTRPGYLHEKLPSRLDTLLDRAIRQALAGPTDSEAYTGEPVLTLVREILADKHVPRIDKRLKRFEVGRTNGRKRQGRDGGPAADGPWRGTDDDGDHDLR